MAHKTPVGLKPKRIAPFWGLWLQWHRPDHAMLPLGFRFDADNSVHASNDFPQFGRQGPAFPFLLSPTAAHVGLRMFGP